MLRWFLLLISMLMSIPTFGAAGLPSASKISVHLLSSYSSGAAQIIQARPRILKILGTDSAMIRAARDYKASTPDGVVVCRIYTPRYWSEAVSPSTAASEFWSTVLAPALAGLSAADRALIDYVEGPNEGDSTPTWATPSEADWYNLFWLQLAPLIANGGFRPLAYNISVGNPPGSAAEIQDRLNRIASSLRVIQQLGGAWSYHAYSIPYGTDPSQEIWYSLRYRQYYAYFASAHPDLVNLPLILTEGGIDGEGPWSTRGDAAKFQNWLMWFDSEIRRDDYCLGLTLFQIGNTTDWSGFNVEPVAGWLASYLASQPGTAEPPELLGCVRESMETLTLRFSGPPHPVLAADPANYVIRRSGTNALAVLGAEVVQSTNVILTTAPPEDGADYLVLASNLVHALETPGPQFLNGQAEVQVPVALIALGVDRLWRYDQRGTPLGILWRSPLYNDSSWAEGAPLFAHETGLLPEPIRTPLTTNEAKLTFYFRTRFDLPAGVSNAWLRLRTVIDDGAVFYINGTESLRLGMPAGGIAYDTTAARTIGNAAYEGPFLMTPANLRAEANLLAVEVHQASPTSSDVVFGASLEALVRPSQIRPAPVLRATREDALLRLEWDEPAQLETAELPTGPWRPLLQTASPLAVAMTNSQAYFRLSR